MPKEAPGLSHPRYSSTGVLGNGTYSFVLAATDKQTGAPVAVKVAHREAAYRRSALAEVSLLKALSHSPNIITMRDSFEHDGRVHIVLDRLHKNLYELLKDRQFEPLPLTQVRDIGRRVLLALSEVHANGYIHCDLKPENIMLRTPNSSVDVVMIDFGAIRKFNENSYYDVQSLWYRAPEVICGVPYTTAIDVWSVGCMLCELYTGSPLFSGNDAQQQLSLIIDMFGLPSHEAMLRGKNSPSLNFSGHRRRRQKTLEEAIGFGEANDAFVQLLYQMLAPNEANRISVAAALNHPFFNSGKSIAPPGGGFTMLREFSNGSFSGLTDNNSNLSSPEWKRSSLNGEDDTETSPGSAAGYGGSPLSLLSVPLRDRLVVHQNDEMIAMMDDWLI